MIKLADIYMYTCGMQSFAKGARAYTDKKKDE